MPRSPKNVHAHTLWKENLFGDTLLSVIESLWDCPFLWFALAPQSGISRRGMSSGVVSWLFTLRARILSCIVKQMPNATPSPVTVGGPYWPIESYAENAFIPYKITPSAISATIPRIPARPIPVNRSNFPFLAGFVWTSRGGDVRNRLGIYLRIAAT